MDLKSNILKVSIVGAHSNFAARGFRQKDVRFIAEIFTNWMDVFLKPDLPTWHNTQALRQLDTLKSDGFATSEGQGKSKRYRLTRVGLIQSVQDLVEVKGFAGLRFVLLNYFFIRSYGERIRALIGKEGSGFSKALQIEVEHLFDHKIYIEKHIQEHQRQIKRLKLRVEETRSARTLALKNHRLGENVDRVIEQVSSRYPYELENQKPMAELFREIEPEIRLWEITQGSLARSEILWNTQLKVLVSDLKILTDLKDVDLSETST